MKILPRFITALALGTSLAMPLFVFAQSGINLNAITPYKEGIIGVINTIFVPVLIAIAFIVFLWGVFKAFIWNKESESEKMEGRKYILWGVIGFVVIFSLWALVNIVRGAFGLTTGNNAPPSPTIGGSAPASNATNLFFDGGDNGSMP